MLKKPTPLARPDDAIAALALLTRLPMPQVNGLRGAEAAWAYPLAGAVVGGLAALAGLVALALGMPGPVVALVTLAALIVPTGALHEDGLADTADGFWGGWTKERRLEIMKDSQIGSYGVIALILALGLRGCALWALWEAGSAGAISAILTASILSRGGMPVVMAALPHARAGGLSQHVGRVAPGTAALGVAVALGLGLLLIGWGALGAGVLIALVISALAWLAMRRIGGQTGDVLGAAQQVAEIVVLLALLT